MLHCVACTATMPPDSISASLRPSDLGTQGRSLKMYSGSENHFLNFRLIE